MIATNELRWVDERVLAADDGTEFLTLGQLEGAFGRMLMAGAGAASAPEQLVVLKTRQEIDRLLGLFERLRPRRAVELGIFRGGSTAMLSMYVEQVVAIEYDDEPVDALEEYLRRRSDDGHVCRTHYGVDQADRAAVARLVREAFGHEPLDLVIDDASHFGPHTRASFEVLFPLLRPGGVYVVEDWSWHLQDLDLPGEPMADFVGELVDAAGRGPGLIAGIDLAWDALFVCRGPQPIEADGFSIAHWRDRDFQRVLHGPGATSQVADGFSIAL